MSDKHEHPNRVEPDIRYFRAIYTVTVLMDQPPPDELNLHDLAYQITEGEWVCAGTTEQIEELTGKQAADALIEAGSEPGFFCLNARGETDYR